jgi:hypothetical protein
MAPSKREGHRPGHGPEQPAFHALQREDRQIGGDDDGDGVKHRPLDLMASLADDLRGGFRGARCPVVAAAWLRWRMMFSTITTAPSTTIPKSSAPSERRFAGMWLRSSQIDAKSRENGIVSATMRAARTLSRNRKG